MAEMLVAILQAAARQRRLMRPWQEDKRFVADEGKLLHAVDSDVVVLYRRPWARAIGTDTEHGYAQIFPNDDPKVSVPLGRALAEHIFFSNKNAPLLILPPIEQELRRMFAALARNAEREQHEAVAQIVGQNLQRLLEDLATSWDRSESLVKLEESFPMLSSLITGEKGPSAELRNFARVLRDSGIMPIDYAIEKKRIDDRTFVDALAPPQTFADKVNLREYREAWFDRLRRTKADRRSNVRIYDDAHALARLEWINQRLDKKHRVVLITGDVSLEQAARGYVPAGMESNFADLYLRHPRCYLAEAGVLSPESDAKKEGPLGTQFLQWLETLLADARMDGESDWKDSDTATGDDRQRFRSVAERILSVRRDYPEDIRRRWEGYTRELAIRYGPPKHITDIFDSKVRRATQLYTSLIVSLHDELERRIRETWEDCFKIATQSVVGSLFINQEESHTAVRPRNVPPVTFDSFPKSRQFVETMQSPIELTGSYEEGIDLLLKEDNSGYTYYLAHALLFAAQGQWLVTRILAGRAIYIAKKKSQPYITGREAYYLQAVARRTSARNVSDLGHVKKMLDDARACLATESEKRRELSRLGIRFDAEELALRLTYRLFHVFEDSEISAEMAPALSELQDEMSKLQIEVQRRLDGLGDDHEDRWFLRNVERNLLINLFMTLLLRSGKQREPIEPGHFREAFRRLENNINSEEKPRIALTYLVNCVYLAAGWWTETNPKARRKARRDLQQQVTRIASEANQVFPYDLKRFEFLRSLSDSY
ncbi:MAG: hypothetical protein ACREXS_08110 [Gammaproteobacteria bacterium]